MKKYIIYKHTTPSNKIYIGITSRNPIKRWNNGNGYQKCPLVWRAIQKYGWENISRKILFTSNDKNKCLLKEKEYIENLQLTNIKFGYNLHEGGKPTGVGDFLTEEGRQKISQSSKRNWQNPEDVRKYIKENLEKIGEIYIFDIYE